MRSEAEASIGRGAMFGKTGLAIEKIAGLTLYGVDVTEIQHQDGGDSNEHHAENKTHQRSVIKMHQA